MSSTALLVIDVQKGLDEASLGKRNNPQAEINMARLIALWRDTGQPVIFIRHCSLQAGSPLREELPGNAYKDAVKPLAQEQEFTKTVNSAFVGTGLDDYLRQRELTALVIVGLTTDHCVSASTRSASDLGYEVTLVTDATAAFDRHGFDGRYYSGDEIHRVNLVSLDNEFCRLRSTAEIIDAMA